MTEYIETNPQRMGGRPTIRRTRFPVAQLLVEICDDNRTPRQVADDFGLEYDDVIGALLEVARGLDNL